MKIDWDSLTEEAVRYLREYLRIDTTNPPGNEGKGADFLRNIIEAEGLKVETYAKRKDRPNILSRLKGRLTDKAFILLHHMDVVGVERENWSIDPFSGEIKDGYIWGRGAIDMKGMGICELMAFLLAKRLSLPLNRDLIYLATPDEEKGSTEGAEWMVENHGDILKGEYLINEGGYGWKSGDISAFYLCIGEKGPLWIRLSVKGTSGHGSIPHDDNACVNLVKALNRIVEYRPPVQIVPEMTSFLEKAGIGSNCKPDELESHLIMKEASISAMFRNTISLTMLNAGHKENVIPSRAEATIDCRLLPGTDKSSFMRELENLIDDPRVNMEVIMDQEPSSSPIDNIMFREICEVLGEIYPGVKVMPMISPGFTDSRCFRKIGVKCYGLLPFLIEKEDLKSVHGRDERLSIDNIKNGIKVIYRLIERLCC